MFLFISLNGGGSLGTHEEFNTYKPLKVSTNFWICGPITLLNGHLTRVAVWGLGGGTLPTNITHTLKGASSPPHPPPIPQLPPPSIFISTIAFLLSSPIQIVQTLPRHSAKSVSLMTPSPWSGSPALMVACSRDFVSGETSLIPNIRQHVCKSFRSEDYSFNEPLERITYALLLTDTVGRSLPVSCMWTSSHPEHPSSPSLVCPLPRPTTSLSTPSMPWGRVATLTTMQFSPSLLRVSLEQPWCPWVWPTAGQPDGPRNS